MIRRYDGKDLARVLIYYGLIPDATVSDFNINCPFHNDPNPSMRINLRDGDFYCFGCNVSGDARTFVQLASPELNDLQSVVVLEKILHSDKIQKMNITYKKRARKRNKQAWNEAHDYYYGLKTVDWKKAGSEDETKAIEYMSERGFDRRAMNIAHCKCNYNVAYPIIFPILDNGEFRGWVCRTTNKRVEKRAKYLYNEGFNKRDTLCGNYEENSVPFICEGFFDYLSLRAKGKQKQCVALLGWHIADEQVKKLKEKGIETVISALDNDDKGNKGTELLKRYFNVIRFPFPEGVKDPGEMSERELKKAISEIRRKQGK